METVKVRSSPSTSSTRAPRSLVLLTCLDQLLTHHLQNAANYVAETVQGTGAEASKEANKQVAKDSDASLSSRATAAKDAAVDKKDETSHNTQADVHKGEHSPP
jgi:adenosyl cobinamide kinase/adenosyl cobinamide phosphate guanylyltransferase